MQPKPTSSSGDEYISAYDLLVRLWASRLLIVVVVALFAVVAWATSFLATREYDAEIMIRPADQGESGAISALGGQFSGLASLAGIDLGGDTTRMEEWLALLESRAFAREFIETQELIPTLYSSYWDSERDAWLIDESELPSINDAVEYFSSKMNVRRVPRGNLVVLRVRWSDPEVAAEWANMLVSMLNEHVRGLAIDQANSSLEYLRQELNRTSIVEIKLGIYALMETQIQAVMYANVNRDYAFRVVDPAVVLDEEDYATPNRVLFFLVGALLGTVFSVLIALMRPANQRPE